MNKSIISIILICFCLLTKQSTVAQELHQTIKGKVFDNESQITLPGANIIILNSDPFLGSNTDVDGNFTIDHVPIGRYDIQVTYIGYEPVVVPNIMVTSSKEVVLNIGLNQSSTKINEVVIKARKDKPLNSMAAISARSFTVEETRRYAGSLDDPARMASAFAGVTVGNIGDNAIIIRGNSPKNVSWRVDGVDIPNPNHFAGANVAGGGFTTIFSSQLMANSDFYTGAFPAEYGNALAGVFDMKLRNGNSEKNEHTIQIGLMGIDIASEGPLKKGTNASYLFNYRYSTISLLSETGIIPTGDQVSKYQDLSFKINLPTTNTGTFSFWGISASDNLQKPAEKDSSSWTNEWQRVDHDWMVNMGTIGLSHKYSLNSKTFIRTTIAASGISNNIYSDRLDSALVLNPNWENKDISSKITLSTMANYKLNTKTNIRTGLNYNALFYNLNMKSTIENDPSTFREFINQNGNSHYFEYYLQIKYQISDKISILPGVNANYLMLNDNYSIDPRLAIKWNINNKHSLNFGFGKHSQREDLKIYFVKDIVNGQTVYPNKNLELSKALHVILGYDWNINENLRLKIEPYYQYLYDIPNVPNSSYSMINYKQDWTFNDSLVNNSTGINKGIDITLERFLHKNFYFLASASLLDSKYKIGNGSWENTRYNKNYVFNLLIGKEFFTKKKNVLGINARLNLTGGERVSPVLMQESVQQERVVYDDSKPFSEQMPAINYLDFTVTYRINKKKYSSVWALQVKNLLGEPYSALEYNFRKKTVERNNVVVILPVLSYKLEF